MHENARRQRNCTTAQRVRATLQATIAAAALLVTPATGAWAMPSGLDMGASAWRAMPAASRAEAIRSVYLHVPLARIDVDFKGGELGEYVDTLHEALGVRFVVVEAAVEDRPVGPIHLDDVRAIEAVMLLDELHQDSIDLHRLEEVVVIGPKREPATHPTQRRGKDAAAEAPAPRNHSTNDSGDTERLMAMSLEQVTDLGRFSRTQVIRALERAAEIAGDVRLEIEEETGLLVVRGEKRAVAFIEQAMERMHEASVRAREAAERTGEAATDAADRTIEDAERAAGRAVERVERALDDAVRRLHDAEFDERVERELVETLERVLETLDDRATGFEDRFETEQLRRMLRDQREAVERAVSEAARELNRSAPQREEIERQMHEELEKLRRHLEAETGAEAHEPDESDR